LKSQWDFSVFLNEISEKWLKEWEKERVYEVDPDPKKPKYFATAAFMYVNSPMHIGHARTYLIPDIIIRYLKMKGVNALYPMGFHYTGTPIIAMAEALASGDEKLIDLFLNIYDVPKEKLSEFKEPLKLARYFHEFSKKVMKKYGLAIDWRREFSTIDPEFQAFIVWQFTKLKEMGFVEQGTHPVGWCPHHKMPVGMHDTKDDVEPEIGEFTLIYFKLVGGFKGFSDVYLPAATLRPETVYGVTNMWLNPDTEYSIIEFDGKKFVVSSDAAYRLTFQKKIKELVKFLGRELIGRKVINPVTGAKVYILPAPFVDPKVGSGVVMSVPAHAPYDYAAIKDLIKDGKELSRLGISPDELRPIPLIRLEGYSEVPARDACIKHGVASQLDKSKLDKATEEIYSKEFKFGIMRGDLSKLVVNEVIEGVREYTSKEIADKPVNIVRDLVKEFLIKHGYGGTMYDIMNKPVYCRCGTEVVVKVLENQWFLNYGNERWKELARKALNKMKIIPEEYRSEFKAVIEWLQRRACARSRGLGTPLPWEKGWIIESLSDSTIYMAFYTVIHKIRRYSIKPGQLTVKFWDYVILGQGDSNELSKELNIPANVLEELREEFNYWYPLDARHSAKDLVPNHLTFFIFNHAAIMPEEKWPRSIVINGWVLVEGEKMSKSRGNILPLHRAIKIYGADCVRATLALTAEFDQDLDLRSKNLITVLEHLRKIYELINAIIRTGKRRGKKNLYDRWVLSVLQRRISTISKALDNTRIREAAVNIMYIMYQDLQKYLELVNGVPHEDIIKYLSSWVRLMAPITPFLAEELWHLIGGEGLVVKSSWPKVDESLIDREAEVFMTYADLLISDVREVLAVSKVRPSKIVIYVDDVNYCIVRDAAKYIRSGKSLREFLSYVGKTYGGRVVSKAKKVYDLVMSMPVYIREDLEVIESIDEKEVVAELRDYIAKSIGYPDVSIEVYSAFDEKAPDYGGKKKYAAPFKPGIFITGK